MTVGDFGEFSLVTRIARRLPQGDGVLLGPGDDAALVSAPDGRVVLSTDLLLEGRHFRRDWSSGQDIGRKAAAQNLADIAAMGARPTALLVGLGLPPGTAVAWVDELFDGLCEECALVGASVVGGDISRSEAVLLGVTALGDLGGRAPVTRAGARPSDVVAVAGRLGHAAAGLALLSAGARGSGPLVDAHRRPRPPYAMGPRAAELGATAMLDVSDGLLQDLGHVADAGGVRIELDSAAFAVPEELRQAAAELDADPLAWMLTGGDDHALAATFPAGTGLSGQWQVIGTVTEGQGVLVDGREFGKGGWDHFAE
ncbi:thiamine-phosphate kinase [Spongiactinospora rosea]|uniref:Thiamine-monophosphate kinase n=1 Tax=Spongiactinospora rosea TaxID=2248750 RepID=A0A366LVS4_9ACTN|nr:thiamine-phosphate kinase [Spongiactinospora rosea]